MGINDLRLGNFWNYRSQLTELIQELRHAVPDVDGIFLPGIDLADAPLLQQYPLRLFLRPLWSFWEREKREAVASLDGVAQMLEPDAVVPTASERLRLFCSDEMHPSLRGYQLWADGLARQISQHIVQRQRLKSLLERAETT